MQDPSRTPSDELVERFHEAVAGIEGVEVRKMFAFPAADVRTLPPKAPKAPKAKGPKTG